MRSTGRPSAREPQSSYLQASRAAPPPSRWNSSPLSARRNGSIAPLPHAESSHSPKMEPDTFPRSPIRSRRTGDRVRSLAHPQSRRNASAHLRIQFQRHDARRTGIYLQNPAHGIRWKIMADKFQFCFRTCRHTERKNRGHKGEFPHGRSEEMLPAPGHPRVTHAD